MRRPRLRKSFRSSQLRVRLRQSIWQVSEYSAASGDRRRIESVLGLSINVPGTTTKDVMDMVLVTQYLDTMKEIGAASKSSVVFIPHGPGPVRDITDQIQDGPENNY